jgi:hypothetical protein
LAKKCNNPESGRKNGPALLVVRILGNQKVAFAPLESMIFVASRKGVRFLGNQICERSYKIKGGIFKKSIYIQ